MIRSFKSKWCGVSDEGLYDAVADCMTFGAGLEVSDFTVEDVKIKRNPDFVRQDEE